VKKILRIAILLGLIAVVTFAFPGTADRVILFPSTNPIPAPGAQRRTIPFQNGELEVWIASSSQAHTKESASIKVLRFYGNADRAERWAALDASAWNNRAVDLWALNYPGFGGSSGKATLAAMARAGVAAFDALRAESPRQPIFIFGASIGTTVALHVAAEREVAGLVLHNPPPLRQMILRRFGWWNLWLIAGPIAWRIPRGLDSVANAQRIHARAIFLLSEQDEVVPIRFQRQVVNAYAGEKRVVALPRAHHNSPIDQAVLPEFYRAYDWLLPR